jgi:hypothetical protein
MRGFHFINRRVLVAAVLGVGLIVLASTSKEMSGQEPKVKPFADPDAAMKLGDADKDGKLSKEEFQKLVANNPRIKDNPKAADFLFDRLDADKDGKLTVDEFKKITDLGAPGGAPKGKFGKGPFAPKKDFAKKEEPKPSATEKPTADQLAFFEKKIRPILVGQCYQCHSEEAKKDKGGLLLDTRQGIRAGGDNGPAVVPGSPTKSLLIKAIKQTDATLKMPPKSKLSDDVVADFEKWIATGAADPREGKAAAEVAKEIDIEKGRQFWSFQPPKATATPTPKDANWSKTDIDRFLLAGLEAKGLKQVSDADPRSLIRRVYFDLVGLPPTPEDVEAFVKDSALRTPHSALESVVEKLLASARFGETWGRHWLDVARFAESSGKSANTSYPHAWRYRDYVIAAFNADKPFDRFIKEQVAGDLLPASNDQEKAKNAIATGFLALGPKSHNEGNRRQFEMDLIDEQIDTTTQAFLGLTIACARCHDHKFDPIPQKDYYALAGIFRSTETCYGTVRSIQSNHPSPLVQLPAKCGEPAGIGPLTTTRRESLEKQIADIRAEIAKLTGSDAFLSGTAIGGRIRIANLQSQIDMFEKDGTPKLQAMGARERFRNTDTALLNRGEVDKPGDIVPRGFPQVLTTRQPRISGSGRQQLADWIASKQNPLTARVYVNRVWHHLFGQGIVPTPDNFGSAGQRPNNPPLLDHLAIWFMENGWSTKKLVRHLVTSRAYQLATTYDAKNHEADPDNALVWRMSPRRIEAEKVRDSMLAISGQLDLEPTKGSDLMRNGEGSANFALRLKGPLAPPDTHRAVYMTIIREQIPESLTLFDFPDPNAVAGERAVTNVPAQALFLLNNPFVIRQSEAAADRLLASSGNDDEKVKRAYETFFSRPPSEKESKAAMEFVKNYSQRSTKRNAWAALTQALFASAEFANLR